ncbi:MAG: carbohydrate porin [Paludibacteraceae bacterium]|nr:carbohydrate porin [Paludibacteraceae bacterium]
MKKRFWIISLLALLFLTGNAQTDSSQNTSAFSYTASYTGDMVNNLNGGIKTGTNYLGMAHIGLGFDTEKARWWKGGEFCIDFMNTHGDTPSANLIGDIQIASNIEAGNLSVLYELWYKQRFGKIAVTVGLQDMNSNYAVTENGGLFVNSSFGVHTVMSDNITLPIFPITALGLNFQWQINNYSNWQITFFDGTPNSRNNYNTNWIVGKEDGYLIVSEFHLAKSLIKEKNGNYKISGYYHQHKSSILGYHENGGIYFIGDQDINKNISIFSQIGYSPNKINIHNHFYSLGINYKEFSKKRTDDMLGLAVAYFGSDNASITHETTIELTYKMVLNEHLYIQPDIQYIINPAGTENKLNNALVGIVRFGMEL